MLKSGLLLGTGNGLVALLGLIRNVLVARLLSVDDFGIASTFAITMALVEMASNIALDRLIVQAEDGDSPILQSTLHTIQLIRGIVGAVFLFLISEPIAWLFGVEEVVWAYQLLAVVPFLRGIAHLDMFRFQRKMNFFPSVWVELSAQGMSTLAAVPLIIWLNDYRAMLFAILLQQFVFFLVSHLVAKRSYKLSWDISVVRKTFRFGWPLLLNGFLMFAIFQGDRIIIANGIGITELGWFSAALTLTFVPSLVVAKTLQSFFLPQLSREKVGSKEFKFLCSVTNQTSWLVGIVFAVSFAFIGPSLFIFLYGSKYEPALPILVMLAVMQGVRISKVGSTIVAISMAATEIPLVANIFRVSIIPITWIVVQKAPNLLTVVSLATFGEAMALAATLYFLRKKQISLLFKQVTPIVICLLTFAWIIIGIHYQQPYPTQIVLALIPFVVIWQMTTLRKWIKSRLFKVS